MMDRHALTAIFITLLLAAMPGVGVIATSAANRSLTGQASKSAAVIPEGTVLTLRMETHLSSKSSSVGDGFKATVIKPVTVNNTVAIPTGSKIEGHVTAVERAKRRGRSGTIAVDFDQLILPDGRSYRVYGELTPLDPEARKKIKEESRISGGSTKKRSIVFIGGGAGVGAIIGAISGGGKGAAVGSGVGAAIGVAGVLLTKGHEAEVNPGTEFGLELLERLELSASSTAPVAGDLSSPEMLRHAQRILLKQGYYDGAIDGVYGPRTHRAIRDFQLDHDLPVTARLDERTARALGIMSGASPESSPNSRPVKVLSAYAERLPDESIHLVVQTEVPTGGWQLYENHAVMNDELHVWARGVPPTGPVTQVVTRGKLEVNLANAPASISKVVVHGAAREVTVDVSTASRSRLRRAESVRQQAQDLVDQYQQALRLRVRDDRLIFSPGRNYTEEEIELLLALHSLADVAHLYAQVMSSVSDQSAQRGAARALLRQARRVDLVLRQTRSRPVKTIAGDWTALRENLNQVALSHGLEWHGGAR